MKQQIVIIGAGLSGLYAAYLLEQRGYSARLLEARARLGGRIIGSAATNRTHEFELGPSWFWSEINPRMQELLTDLQLPFFNQHHIGALLSESGNQTLQRWDNADDDIAYQRLEGGMTMLIKTLSARLKRTEVQLDSQVQEIRQRDDGRLDLSLLHHGQSELIVADRVITAVPPRLLAHSMAWWPALPPDLTAQWSDTPTWMAGQAKLVATYPQAFWRAAGCSGEARSQRGPLTEIHDASNADGSQAALFGFIGVPASARQRYGQEQLIALGLQQLVRLFGPEAATPDWIEIKDWATDTYTATAADSQPLRHHPTYRKPALPAHWADRVFLAGTEFSARYGGFMEGALDAAQQAVLALDQHLTATGSVPA